MGETEKPASVLSSAATLWVSHFTSAPLPPLTLQLTGMCIAAREALGAVALSTEAEAEAITS